MQTNDVTELILVLLRSTAQYSYKRIPKGSKREAYAKAMTNCILVIETAAINLMQTRTNVELIKNNLHTIYPASFFNSNKAERTHYVLAVDQCLEIIDKLEARFITGAADLDPRMYRDKGLFVYSDEHVF
jgi:hypothetical protein